MKLYPHQQKFIEENPSKHLLAYDTGLGKTYTSILWAKKNLFTTLLVICPKTIKDQWEDNLKEHLPDIQTAVVTKEYFRDKFDKKQKVDGIIVDEAHVVASTTSKLHKELYKYLKKHNVAYRLFLTATPVLSKGSMNIYALTRLLGNDIPLPKWRAAFQKQIVQRITGGRVIMPWVDKEDAATQDKLISYINKIGTLVDKTEVYDVPVQLEKTHWIPYTPALEKNIRQEIDGETEHIAIWTKTHRLEQSIKVDKVKDLAFKYNKVIIVVRYTSDVEVYKEIFPEAYTLTGASKNRGDLLKEVLASTSYIFIVNSAISEGYELPDTEAIIFSSLDFSIKNFIQMKGRALRMNKPSETDIHIVITKGGSDENVYDSIRAKKDFNLKMFLSTGKV